MTDPVRVFTESFLAPERWIQDGACGQTDPDAWFPEHNTAVAYTDMAKRVCASCPVIDQCLEYALRAKETNGIWGGRTPRQLRRIRETRRAYGGRA